MNNEAKKNVATGISTAAGATAGVVLGTAITPNYAEAAEVVRHEYDPQLAEVSDPEPQSAYEPDPEPAPSSKTEPTPQNNSVPDTPNDTKDDDVEVLSYDRMTDEDGNQMDIAVISMNGNEVAVVDANLDGEADALVCDINHNGVIEEGEVETVQGQGIAMKPLADAVGFNPLFAQNDLPDYVNDADVDNYMA